MYSFGLAIEIRRQPSSPDHYAASDAGSWDEHEPFLSGADGRSARWNWFPEKPLPAEE